MKVRLIGEHNLTDRSIVVGQTLAGPGRVPDGTIIEHKDAHWLVRMKRAEEVKNASGKSATPGNDPVAHSDG